MKIKSLIIALLVLILLLSGCTKKNNEEEKEEDKDNVGMANPWVEVNDVSEIWTQLEGEFFIDIPEGYEIKYMAKGNPDMLGQIPKSGKIIYSNSNNKEICIQILRDTQLYDDASKTDEEVIANKLKAYKNKETSRLTYLQEEYTVLVDMDKGSVEDVLTLVGVASLM